MFKYMSDFVCYFIMHSDSTYLTGGLGTSLIAQQTPPRSLGQSQSGSRLGGGTTTWATARPGGQVLVQQLMAANNQARSSLRYGAMRNADNFVVVLMCLDFDLIGIS